MRALRSGLVVSLFAAVLALLAWRASVKPFWHDEIYTILEAELPVATLFRALHDGIDLQPPLNVLLTRAIHLTAGVGPIVTRLPAIAGLLLAAVFTFIVVRRRTNGLIATSAVLLLCTTPAWGYATEARGYGLTLGAFAIALFAWTEAAAGRHPTRNWILLAVSLAAGVWAHYYFVLAFVPIGLGEIARQLRLKKFMAQAWLAMAAAMLLTAPLWPIASAASSQTKTFWAVPNWNLSVAYRQITGSVFSATVIVILGVLAVVAIAAHLRARRWPPMIPGHEMAAAAGCLAIPLFGILLGHWVGAFYVGYITFAAVGVAMVLPLAIRALLPRHTAIDLLLAGTMAIAMIPVVTRTLAERGRLPDAASDYPMVVDWLRGGEPIIFSGGASYLEIWYSLPEHDRPRFMYLADPQGARRDSGGFDTVELGYLALSRWTGLPVVPLSEYVAAHPRFWFYTIERNGAQLTLRDMGAQLIEHAQEDRRRYGRRRVGTLYEVRMPPR